MQEINKQISKQMQQIQNYSSIHQNVLTKLNNLLIYFLVILIKIKLMIFDKNHFLLMILKLKIGLIMFINNK